MTPRQMLMVYVMLAKLAHNYSMDSAEHDAILAEMTSLRERMP